MAEAVGLMPGSPRRTPWNWNAHDRSGRPEPRMLLPQPRRPHAGAGARRGSRPWCVNVAPCCFQPSRCLSRRCKCSAWPGAWPMRRCWPGRRCAWPAPGTRRGQQHRRRARQLRRLGTTGAQAAARGRCGRPVGSLPVLQQPGRPAEPLAPVRRPAQTAHELVLRLARRAGVAPDTCDGAGFQVLADMASQAWSMPSPIST